MTTALDWIVTVLCLAGIGLVGWIMVWQSELDIRRARRWTQVQAFRREWHEAAWLNPDGTTEPVWVSGRWPDLKFSSEPRLRRVK